MGSGASAAPAAEQDGHCCLLSGGAGASAWASARPGAPPAVGAAASTCDGAEAPVSGAACGEVEAPAAALSECKSLGGDSTSAAGSVAGADEVAVVEVSEDDLSSVEPPSLPREALAAAVAPAVNPPEYKDRQDRPRPQLPRPPHEALGLVQEGLQEGVREPYCPLPGALDDEAPFGGHGEAFCQEQRPPATRKAASVESLSSPRSTAALSEVGSNSTHSGGAGSASAAAASLLRAAAVVDRGRRPDRGSDDDASASTNQCQQRREIITDQAFRSLYRLGPEVMPSTNPDMQVRYAARLEDGLSVVVKVRGKAGSFVCLEEEKEWRTMTECLLNLPDCKGRAKLVDVFEDQRRYYIVMEHVDGLDLQEYLEQFRSSPPRSECKEIIRQTLSAVAELHARGLIHKDLKLENVVVHVGKQHDSHPSEVDRQARQDLAEQRASNAPSSPRANEAHFMTTWSTLDTECDSLGESGACTPTRAKLIDFDTVEEYSLRSNVARTVVGTDQYIAQEAYAGRYSPLSDMFAVGVIAYRLLTGEFPFKNELFDDEEGENWVGSPKMLQIQRKVRKYKINYNRAPFNEDRQARNFCESLLAADEFSRLSAKEALAHPFLNAKEGVSAEGSQTKDLPCGFKVWTRPSTFFAAAGASMRAVVRR